MSGLDCCPQEEPLLRFLASSGRCESAAVMRRHVERKQVMTRLRAEAMMSNDAHPQLGSPGGLMGCMLGALSLTKTCILQHGERLLCAT